jgi:ATP-binding cassette subfamily B protein
MILAAFAEILSIGAVLPFLAVLTDPARIFQHPVAQPFIKTLDLSTPHQLLLPLTIFFGSAALVAGAMRLLLLWASTRLSFAIGADLSIGIYSRTLYQPYEIHIARHTSEIISGISIKTNNVIYMTLLPTLTFISSIVMVAVILSALVSVDPFIALTSFAGFSTLYGLMAWISRSRLLVDSHLIALGSTQIIKSMQEGLGGIRDILINGSQPVYREIYRNADRLLRNAQGRNAFISASPRYIVEALGMVFIAILAYSISQQTEGMAKVIPVLGVLALGAQRLLPVLQQAYASYSTILGGRASLVDTLILLDQPMPKHTDQSSLAPLPFNQCISLNQLSYRYSPATPWVLENINLSIPKGSRFGFIGVTGSGKSTLLDIMIGLLQPTNGELCIDKNPITRANQQAWQAHIAHVPQTIFLADGSIEENIAFGVPKNKIDHERVQLAARKAQIADVIEAWPEQYQTFVGERGVRLSGGQRQRIAIARALYKQADVIIFDEATSALDNETEEAVMQAIEGLSKELTVLIIAHRLTTLKNCSQIIELANGRIERIGTYQDIVTQKA